MPLVCGLAVPVLIVPDSVLARDGALSKCRRRRSQRAAAGVAVRGDAGCDHIPEVHQGRGRLLFAVPGDCRRPDRCPRAFAWTAHRGRCRADCQSVEQPPARPFIAGGKRLRPVIHSWPARAPRAFVGLAAGAERSGGVIQREPATGPELMRELMADKRAGKQAAGTGQWGYVPH
jgi:hypothetical protein